MDKFLNKARGKITEQLNKHIPGDGQPFFRPDQEGSAAGQTAISTSCNPLQPPTAEDCFRYRYQYGTNLGSIFVLEKWLSGSMFPEGAEGTAELAAATAQLKQKGLSGAVQAFENHWRTALIDEDLDWLANVAHCATIRLPIGFWDLGPEFCKGTPFANVAQVYTSAWAFIKNTVARCHESGIGVLIDVHGLPGGANENEHSGTNSGKAELWGNRAYLELSIRCFEFIATEVRNGMRGVIGLQLCNEAERNIPGMYKWYDRCLQAVQRIDATMPIYISDAWDLPPCIEYCKRKNVAAALNSNPVFIDTHLYWAFHDPGSPQHAIQDVSNKLRALDGKDGNVIDGGAVQAFVGEYSCVLNEDTWSKSGGETREHLETGFGRAQVHRYVERSGGCTFWTYKMDWMQWAGGWGFRSQTDAGNISCPANLKLSHDDVHSRLSRALVDRNGKLESAFNSHVTYWSQTSPGQAFEHWRYRIGYEHGFDDLTVFFGMRANGQIPSRGPPTGGDLIGCLDMWVLKRIRDTGTAGPFAWLYEQGFRKGYEDCRQSLGV
ncbi:glycoside hydrolase [Eremomyces bilateralis CBS 781.70]|uniref:Glycoside hydrolase n=1 Tax=Eremomyces bilateralis CBS 781.70 TaxID=1392243 RepID=A0A6G1FYT6_9PEZI|nr:glycoside hydrolase [Eremomyces bilateralis CBS 781.70]KAF1810882.1 glycoside hydrolase [Eremomyces bilateralis CBS 781.70]